LFISFKWIDASSSDYPPDKKTTPGRAGTIVLDKVLTVYHAISAGEFLSGHSEPGVTILGFKRQPSMMTLCSRRAFMHAAKTLSEASAQTSML